LGVVFYEMLAGRPPFVGEHFSGLMLDIMQRDPPQLSSLRTDVTYGQPPFRAYQLERAADNETPFAAVEAPLELRHGEPLTLRIFLDRPLLEVFANDRQCLTQQIFPSRQDSLLVRAYASGGAATVRSAEGWEMAPLQFTVEKFGLPSRPA